MARKPRAVVDKDMLPEYDFSGGVRGKYYGRYQQGTNLVLLEPDIAEAFPDSASVNRALRVLVNVAATTVAKPKRAGKTRRRTLASNASGSR
jgi:hypothetical protein